MSLRARLGLAWLCCLSVSLLSISDANGDLVECNVTAVAASGVLFACPQGDGDRLDQTGLTVTVTLYDPTHLPAPDVSTDYIWLETCNGLLVACGDGGKIHASAPTDANGQTTITGRFAVGGCDNGGVRVSVNIPTGGPIPGAVYCQTACLAISVRTPDVNGDLVVNLIDFAVFGGPNGYPSPPKPYNPCIDFTAPFGTVTLGDFAKFGTHIGHTC
jgi:hypothetical protein